MRSVEYALEVGYRHIDTAQMYGNERDVGIAVRNSGLPRHGLFLTTKIWPDSFRKGELHGAAAASVERLGCVPDLLLLHWPNPEVPLAETIEALVDVQARGLTRHIGVSNFPTALMAEAIRLSPVPLVTNQVEYHPFLRQKQVLAACRAAGMALTAYCPLARGRVFGHPVLRRIGARYGKTEGQVALRWLVQQPMVVALPRSAKPEHVRSNFEIFDFTLTPRDMEEIAALAHPRGRIVDIAGRAAAWDPE